MCAAGRLRCLKDLPGVHEVVWVQGALDVRHQIDRAAEFLAQRRLLSHADAVFARTGAIQSNGARDEPVVETFRGVSLFDVCRIEQ